MIFNKQIIMTAIWTAIAVPLEALPIVPAQAGIAVGIGINVAIPPPPLPVYVQPPLPAPGYLWTPGYWTYGDAGYYWVPGVWVLPPVVGVLWTPGYWGFGEGFYRWHTGYWGPRVGFYGGVNYGFGYGGVGFFGGYWHGGAFAYNRAAANFGGTHVANFYNNTTIVRQNTVINNNHVSYNGGENGIRAQPTAQQARYASENHLPPTANQDEQRHFASLDRGQLASVNHGRPATMAVADHAAYARTAQARESTRPITAADRAQGMRYRPNERAANQDQRIGNGLKTGQMTAGEAARDNQRQANLDRQIHNDRMSNGGRLNAQERGQVNHRQNIQSRQIHRQEHNERERR